MATVFNDSKRLSKKDFAKQIGVTQQCLYSYHNIAMFHRKFKNSYPTIEGELTTKVGLNDYQQWVILELMKLRKAGLPKDKMFGLNGYRQKVISMEMEQYLISAYHEHQTKTTPNYLVFTTVNWG